MERHLKGAILRRIADLESPPKLQFRHDLDNLARQREELRGASSHDPLVQSLPARPGLDSRSPSDSLNSGARRSARQIAGYFAKHWLVAGVVTALTASPAGFGRIHSKCPRRRLAGWPPPARARHRV